MKMEAGFLNDSEMVLTPGQKAISTVTTTAFAIKNFHEFMFLLLLGAVGAANARMVGTLQSSPDGSTDWQNLLDRDGNPVQFDVTDNVAAETFANSSRQVRVDARQWPEDRPFARLSIVITNGTIDMAIGAITTSPKEAPQVGKGNIKRLLAFREHKFIAGNP
jgi:hypothetical protein